MGRHYAESKPYFKINNLTPVYMKKIVYAGEYTIKRKKLKKSIDKSI